MIRNSLSTGFLLIAVVIATPGCDAFKPKKEDNPSGAKTSDGSVSSKPTATKPGATAADAKIVLNQCIAKYKALKSYEDRAVLRLRIPFDKNPIEETDALRVAYESPNRLAIQAVDVQSSWSGTKWEAIIGTAKDKPFGDQRLVRPLPSRIDIAWLLVDNLGPYLDKPLTGVPLQLQLLLHDKPLSYWLNDTTKLSLLEPVTFDNAKCDRVKVESKLGDKDSTWVLWIDQSNKLLRKYEMPIELIELLYQNQGGLPPGLDKSKTELSVEFLDARVDTSIDWSVWNIPKKDDDFLVSRLIDAPPRNISPLLGTTLKPFDLRDSNSKIILDSQQRIKPITVLLWVGSDELSEKFVKYVLDVRLELERRSLNGSVEIVFVSRSPAKEMLDTFKKWNCDLPLAIDTENVSLNVFGLRQSPAVVVLDKKVGVQHINEFGNLEIIPDLVESLKNGVDVASRILQDKLNDEARYTSRLHRAAIDKTQLGALAPIEPFPFTFHETRNSWQELFKDRIIAAGGEQFYPSPTAAIAPDKIFDRKSGRSRLMTVLDEGGYVYTIDNTGTKERIAKLPVEKANNAKRIHVLPDPWSHRWIAIVPEGLPRYWLVETTSGVVADTAAEPADALEFDLAEDESVVVAAWTNRGKKSSLSLTTTASKMLVLDPETKKTPIGVIESAAAIVPTINPKGEATAWNLVESNGLVVPVTNLPADESAANEPAPNEPSSKQLSFPPQPGAWTWGVNHGKAVYVGLAQLATGETGSVVQSDKFETGVRHPLSVRPDQCRILSSTTLSNGSYYWLATAPNRVLHLQTIDGIVPDQMSLGKRILGATILPDGDNLRVILATEDDVSCCQLTVPKTRVSPTDGSETVTPSTASPSEKTGG